MKCTLAKAKRLADKNTAACRCICSYFYITKKSEHAKGWNFKYKLTSTHAVNMKRNGYQFKDFPPTPNRSALFHNPSEAVFLVMTFFFSLTSSGSHSVNVR